MTTTALGTWRNPPLAYVVAELIISPYYSISAAISRLQDTLRSTYPRTVEGQELVIDGAPQPTTQPLWQLISEDQGRAVQLGTRALSLHATLYADSRDFLDRWAEVLKAVTEAKLQPFVERAGLRYVDLVVPTEGRQPTDYLASGLRGVVPPEATARGAIWASSFTFDRCQVSARIGAPSPEGILLPPNFNAVALRKPVVMVEAEKRLAAKEQIGFIDTDCQAQVQRNLVASDILKLYSMMQQRTSKTFRSLLSETAIKEWM
jgi:uncharacterized protein (TIGR04255 family)